MKGALLRCFMLPSKSLSIKMHVTIESDTRDWKWHVTINLVDKEVDDEE